MFQNSEEFEHSKFKLGLLTCYEDVYLSRWKKKKVLYQSIGLAVTLKHLDKWSVGLYVTLAWGLPNVKGRPDLTTRGGASWSVGLVSRTQKPLEIQGIFLL